MSDGTPDSFGEVRGLVRTPSIWLLALALSFLALLACSQSEDQPESPPEPTAGLEVTDTATPAVGTASPEAPTPTPTAPPARPPTGTVTALTASPTAVVRATSRPSPPTATPTTRPSPTSTVAPLPTPLSPAVLHSEGLWAGNVEATGPRGPGPPPPWLALRVIPGEDPDVDLWQLEGGPVGDLPPAFRCRPKRRDTGWELSSCIGLRGVIFTAFFPAEADRGMEVTVVDRPLTLRGVLTLVPKADEAQASSNVSLLWHQPGEGIHSEIGAADGLVFAPHYSDGDIEILDAESGLQLGTASVPPIGPRTIVFDVKARDGLLYAGTVPNGLVVFDVSDPTAPELIGEHQVFRGQGDADNFFNIHNIFLSPDGSLVYAINHSTFPGGDLRIIDVSDPTTPVEAGRFSIEDPGEFDFVHDINVIERDGRLIAFLNHVTTGLLILDVTDPASVSVMSSTRWDGTFSHSGWPFAIGDKLYYAHNDEGPDQHMTVLDVTDLTDPLVVSRFSTRPGLSIHNVEVVDGIAYISYYIDGLRVVDLRDPANPREIGHFDTVAEDQERDILLGAWGVHVLDGVVYISDFEAGTYALRVELE